MTNINIQLDSALKKQAASILSELGLTIPIATTIFLTQVVRYRGLPFEMRVDNSCYEKRTMAQAEHREETES